MSHSYFSLVSSPRPDLISILRLLVPRRHLRLNAASRRHLRQSCFKCGKFFEYFVPSLSPTGVQRLTRLAELSGSSNQPIARCENRPRFSRRAMWRLERLRKYRPLGAELFGCEPSGAQDGTFDPSAEQVCGLRFRNIGSDFRD